MNTTLASKQPAASPWYYRFFRSRGPKWMNFIERRIPYPLRATKLSLDFNPFGFWIKPSFHRRKHLTEQAKAQGETQWYFRWLWFQITYSRWV